MLIGAAILVWWLTTGRADADSSMSAPANAATSTATPGAITGGDAPELSGILPAETSMGVVDLAVRDLGAMTGFYRDVIGLDVIEQSDAVVILGREVPLIRLETTDAGADDPRSAGLYHSAILFADAPSLAQVLLRIAQQAPQSYQGSADHAVSLAFYIGDPEGNSIELYLDRPREEWVWQDGHVVMGSAPLDPNAFINEHAGGTASDAVEMGHVHLRVGDLETARTFYSEVLGFDVTAESDGALFYSAGGYHHHLATNTWQSAGAGARGVTAGLRGITVAVPAASDLDAIAMRLTDAGVSHESLERTVVTADPWGNTVRFVAG